MGRIIDKINTRRQRQKSSASHHDDTINSMPSHWYYSFEFFPPKTEAGLDNLLTRIDRMSRRLDPLFVDVTWGSAGSTSARTMAVASHAQRYCGVDVLMHLSCTGMTNELLTQTLQQIRSSGIQNILVLRGDPPRGKRSWNPKDVSGGDCHRAIDLVRLIRHLHGDYFGIAVAGHPEGHPSSESQQDEIKHLKEKMDAGADFIITQFFYDTHVFIEYVKTCRQYGIHCPILPGIMPIQSYSSFVRMTEYCGIAVPKAVMDLLEPVKHDDEAIKEIGCDIAKSMCETMLTTPLEDGGVDGVHFYTLNLERSVTRILLNLGAIDLITPSENVETMAKGRMRIESFSNLEIVSSAGRKLPWRPSAMEKRSKEKIRPINWANRPKSYVMRTEDWDEFPNGRWGDATSPAFGELSDVSHFYSFTLGSDDDRRAMLGHCPRSKRDVYEVFAKYVEGGVPHIPWCETPLQPESFVIQPQLAQLNRAGFLSINSQPAVNGAPSTHSTFGWGGPGGYVYQKAYCECFVSPQNANKLVTMVTDNPTMNLYAVNNFGHELYVGVEEGGVTALTWGVFPNREILQPTIFDPSTFLIWAEEAFSLWTSMWLNLYDAETESYGVIEDIRDTFYLVAIIDNAFTSPTESRIFSAMFDVVKDES